MALTLTVSLADQQFAKTKTIGILNVSLGLSRALCRHLALSRLTLLANASLPQIGEPGSARVQRSDFGGIEGFGRFWWDQFAAYHAAGKTGNDWLFLPKGYASFLRRPPLKLVTYVHDCMQEHYRLHHPNAYPRFEGTYFRACLKATVKQSRVILVNSKFTAAELQRFAQTCGVMPPPIVPVGVGFERPPVSVPASRTRIVVLASRWPHKLTGLAIDYTSRWQQQSNYTGSVDWVGELGEGISLSKLKNWQLHGRLNSSEYTRLQSEATAVLYFSEYEGFGMPPVEAVLTGACPVYSSIPATEEVMQGSGCSFRNESFESFAAALDKALKMPERQIQEWAEQLLVRYTWEKVAEKAVAAIQAAS